MFLGSLVGEIVLFGLFSEVLFFFCFYSPFYFFLNLVEFFRSYHDSSFLLLC